jgi:hypothetical protein
MYPDSERGYSMVETVDFHDPAAYDTLRESLKLAALDSEDAVQHAFATSETDFSYVKHNSDPMSFSLSFTDEISGLTVTALSDLETSFTIEFFTYDNEGRKPFLPTSKEIVRLTELLQQESEFISPATTLDGMPDDSISSLETPESHVVDNGKIIHSQKHVQNILDQLGFDSSDSSA